MFVSVYPDGCSTFPCSTNSPAKPFSDKKLQNIRTLMLSIMAYMVFDTLINTLTKFDLRELASCLTFIDSRIEKLHRVLG